MPSNVTKGLSLHRHVWVPVEGASHTVVALHGTGGDENDLVPLVRQLYPNSNILGVRGNVMENGHPRFFKRFAEGMFDEADIRVRANDLAAFYEAAETAYGLSANTTTWLGYSNGANMIAAKLLLDDLIRDAVLLRAQHPLKQRPGQPVRVSDGARVKLFSGEYDTVVPVAESRRLADALVKRGYAVEHVSQPTGHQLSHHDIEMLMPK